MTDALHKGGFTSDQQINGFPGKMHGAKHAEPSLNCLSVIRTSVIQYLTPSSASG
jgi:hypothetical protein